MTAPLTDQEKIADLERANESLKTELIVISKELQDSRDKIAELSAELLSDKKKIIELQEGKQ